MNTRVKLLILILMLGASTGLYLQLASLPRALEQAEARVHKSLAQHLATVANGLGPLIKQGNLHEIHRQLDAVSKSNRDFLDVQLLDAAGNKLYPRDLSRSSEHQPNHMDTRPSEPAPPAHGNDSHLTSVPRGHRHISQGDTVHVHDQPVIHDGVVIGRLMLTQSLQTKFQGIQAAYRNFHTTLTIAILVALAVVMVLVRAEFELSKKSALLDELQRQKSLFEAIFNHVPDALVIANKDRKIHMCNPGVTRMFGYTRHELLDKSTALLYESEEEFNRLGRIRYNVEADENLVPDEASFRRENGDVFPAETIGTVIKANDGKPIGLLGLIRDISERKQAELRLKERTKRLEGLIRTAAKIAATVETNETLDAISEEAANLLGVEGAGFRLFEHNQLVTRGKYGLAHKVMLATSIEMGESLTGRVAQEGRPITVTDLRYDQRYHRNHKDAAIAHGVVAYLGVPLFYHEQIIGVLNVYGKKEHTFPKEEIDLLRAFGHQAAIAIEKARLYEQATQQAEKLRTEITERKQAEEEREALYGQLIDASRQAGKAEIATGVLHNVGNVLNSLNVSATLVADRVRDSKIAKLTKVSRLLKRHTNNLAQFMTSNEKGKRLPEYLSSLADHLDQEQQIILCELQSIVENVHHIKQIVIRQQSYASDSGISQPTVIADLLDDSLSMNVSERHGIEIVREYDDIPAATLDKHKVLQIVVNVIQNAKQAVNECAAHEKKIVLRIRDDRSKRVYIEVMDNGVGIAPNDMPRIFEYGFTTKENGHGFGLHVSANTAKEVGGSLTCRSEGVGKGATFILELPFEPAEMAA